MSYYDRDGRPIGCMEWGELLADNRYKRIARDKIGDWEVSTVWLGLNHQYMDGPPLIFETKVFGGPLDDYIEQYTTEDEAKSGHLRIVAQIRKAQEANDV